ncbi:MAG: hypothetical protein EAZ89_17025 [Bacteroidetes bacterium]|nr:MAG: hypothetical protein EAZ89_17025 [Bacteroidota bacterium]
MNPHALIFVIWAASFFLPACQTSGGAPATGEPITREVLNDNFRKDRRMYLVYPDGEWSAAYKSLIDSMKVRMPWFRMEVRSAGELSRDSLGVHALMLVGTPESMPLIAELASGLPVTLSKGSFTFDGRTYSQPNHTLNLSFLPNPVGGQLPISLLTGNSDTAVCNQLKEMVRGGRGGFMGRWNYQLFEGNTRLIVGDLSETWQFDHVRHWDFSASQTEPFKSRSFTLYPHQTALSQSQLAVLADSLEARREEIGAFTGKTTTAPVRYHLYATAELMGMMTQRMEQSFAIPETREAHVLVNEDYSDNFTEAENILLIREALGTSGVLALEEGLAIRFARRWQRKGYAYWAARLYASHNLVIVKDLCDNEYFRNESSLVRGCLSAALVSYLTETWGKETFLRRYTTWKPDAQELAALEAGWQSWNRANAEKYPAEAWTKAPLPFLKGMTLAHEGYSIYNGYGSALAGDEIEKLQNLGANLIALVPYSGSREVNKPNVFRFSREAGGENDLATTASHYDARDQGMLTLLKPQIWFSGGWPGDLEMKNEPDWKLFFTYYRRWIRHYAMLAAIHEMDAFCVGVEFLKASTSHPQEWRTLTQDMRQIYGGPVTYAANWGEEAEKIAFADALDFIGVNSYYPLSDKDSASDEELRASFAKVMTKMADISERTGKAIVFTEIGFRSITSPWKQPHANPSGQAVLGAHQARCYRVVLDGLRGKAWCGGIVWWKWPSHAGYEKEDPYCFTPNTKPAEAVLREAYGKVW